MKSPILILIELIFPKHMLRGNIKNMNCVLIISATVVLPVLRKFLFSEFMWEKQ